MIRKLLSIGFILFSTVASTLFAIKGKYVHEQMLFNYMAPKIYKVTNIAERGSGSGSVVVLPSGKRVVLTNRHVCDLRDSSNQMKLIDDKGVRHIRNVIKIDSEHDLCAIEAVNQGDDGLQLADASLGVSDHVFVVGHPAGRPTTLQYGMIVELEYSAVVSYGEPREGEQCWGENISVRDELKKGGLKPEEIERIIQFLGFENMCVKTLKSIMTSAAGEPGNSGSPVVDFYGSLVGVLFAGDSSPHMSLLVPHAAIKKFLESL